MPLISPEGCISDIFVSEEEFIERFTGKQLFAWGCNTQGSVGNNTVTNVSSPVQTVAGGSNWKISSAGGDITTNGGIAAGIKTDGTLWSWGYGSFGRLGNNDITSRSSPVQEASASTTWRAVSAGTFHMSATKTDGSLWSWGAGTGGRLGNNSELHFSTPVQTFSSGTNWSKTSSGFVASAAIKTDGTLWSWGSNGSGTLGTGDVTNHSTPIQTTTAGTSWKSVSMGCFSVGAIKTDGTLWVWGNNNTGQLGIDRSAGAVTGTSSPTQTITSGTIWKSISVGSVNMAAIKTDGTLWVWGANVSGQLGRNDTIFRSSPVQTVTGGTNWRTVAVGRNNTMMFGIKTDGSLWGWGVAGLGSLGNSTTTPDISSPIQIGTSTTWKSLGVGRSVTALKTED